MGPKVCPYGAYGAHLKERSDRMLVETAILKTIPAEKRYNVYIDGQSRTGAANSFFNHQHTDKNRFLQGAPNRGQPSSFAGRTQSEGVREAVSASNRG